MTAKRQDKDWPFVVPRNSWAGLIFLTLLTASCQPKIEDPNTEATALAQQAAAMHNPKLCLQARLSESCFAQAADLTGDASLCDMITNADKLLQETNKTHCFNAMAEKLRDPAVCYHIPASTPYTRNLRQSECVAHVYEVMASTSTDIGLCETATFFRKKSGVNSTLPGTCYGNVARNAHNVRLCDLLSGSDRTLCQQIVAKDEHDCSMIEEASARITCEKASSQAPAGPS